MMGHVDSGVASMQDGDSPPYYECAIVCISGSDGFYRPRALHADAQIFLASRLDLDGHPRLAALAGNTTSMRIFHRRSAEASEGERWCSNRRVVSQESIPQP